MSADERGMALLCLDFAASRGAPAQDAEYLKKLELVVKELDEEVPDAGFDAKKLGSLVAQLMQFQEDTLGKEVYPRWIKDSELYNEWMHPQDYEAEPPLAQQAQQQLAAQQAAAAAQQQALAAAEAAAAAPLPAALVAPLPGQHVPRPGGAGGAPGGPPQHAPLAGGAQPPPSQQHPQQTPTLASGAAGGAAPMEVEHRRPPPPGAGLLGAPASMMAVAGGGAAAQQPAATPRPIAPGAAPAYTDPAGGSFPAGASAFTAGAPAAAPATVHLGPPVIAPLPGSQKSSGAARAAARAAAAAAANRDAGAPAAKKARTEVFTRPDVIEGFGQRVAVNAVRQRVLDGRKPAVDPAGQVENVSQVRVCVLRGG
ncbi:hypothetical protein TSOC_010894 [Tetrabaena socialis]|uniref:Uncharacterized protein n=1 Tax=Tetrabaena socialis TaxID=47790 RepID=A0A2J7ZS24_9CHLO|nr:hypothetical protein TSOC_010894 [Tetrabaena socialis]|eukprot:PNH03072.1 hypothetical protein TSOC_010894 [Tetrabaena socialis]